MQKINSYIFVYGTLLNKENEFAAYLAVNCTFVSHAKIEGKLYDIGEYPGAVVADDGESWVYGSVFCMNGPELILRHLDAYEGFGEGQPQPNLFVRELLTVHTLDNTLECWVYLYNLSVYGLRQIVSGNYWNI